MLFNIGSEFVDLEKINFERVLDRLGLNKEERQAAQRVLKAYNACSLDLKNNDHFKTRGELEKIACLPCAVGEIRLFEGRAIDARLHYDGEFINKLIERELLFRTERNVNNNIQPFYSLNPKKIYELSK